MSWKTRWRLEAWAWVQRLNAVAHQWGELERKGVGAARTRRARALRVRDWIYEVIDLFLGGVDALPNVHPIKRKPKGAKTKPSRVIDEAFGGWRRATDLRGLAGLPQLAIGGAVLVTVASVGAWITNEEERVILAREALIRAIGPNMPTSSTYARKSVVSSVRPGNLNMPGT